MAPVTPEIAAQLRLPPGATGLAVAAVDPSGPSAQLLFPGDVITAVVGPEGTRPIRTVVELQAATQNPRNGVVSLLVTSAQGTRVVNVPVRQ